MDNFIAKLSDLPVALLTLAGVAFAMAFNIGFFWAVGIRFLSLFSIQEHIIFSFSGCAVIFTIGIILLQTFDYLTTTFKAPRDRYFYLNTFIFCSAMIMLGGSIVYSNYRDAGFLTAMFLFVVIGASVAILVALLGGIRDFRVLAIAVITVGMAGAYYGLYSVFSQSDHKDNWATLPSGERFGIVRAGGEYSLLVSGDAVVMVAKTADLSLRSDRNLNRKPTVRENDPATTSRGTQGH